MLACLLCLAGRVAPLAPAREDADEAVRAPSCRADGHDGPFHFHRAEHPGHRCHERRNFG